MDTQYELVMKRSDIDESEYSKTELGMLDMLEEGRCTPSYLADELDVTQVHVRNRLKELKRLGLVERVHRGLYEIKEENDD